MNCDSFNDFILEVQPNIVLFDRFLTEEQFGWRIAEHAPNALRILDTEDLHSLRHLREQCHKKQIPFATDIWIRDTKTKREIASIYRCDLSLIISDFEMELLIKTLRIDENLLLHLPFMVDASDIPKQTKLFEERKDFIFIGGGKHLPNLAAIKRLKKAIWPKLRKQLPNVNLTVYGAYLPEEILDLNQDLNGFKVFGRAKDVSEVMQDARVCLAPLSFGAGIKGKLLHAMQFGTPSITTTIGAEGMHGDLEWNGAITDKESDFVKAAIELYQNRIQWLEAQNNGYKILRNRYQKNILVKKFSSKINSIRKNLTAHRNENFIGSMLLHQTMASTKYMSKWIQEKNKNK
ncbi:glycosyltransferase [Maribacter chungangensis]|uniref:Glycosyltransferase n=1 Tax=Maribacter chungangensis TaxID=1069117 RepID=A0ABW3B2L9_9FLAO